MAWRKLVRVSRHLVFLSFLICTDNSFCLVLSVVCYLFVSYFYNPSPSRMFLSLDLLWEYRTQHGANGPLYVTSNYSAWIFCRGVSFWKSNFTQQLGYRFDIMDTIFFLFWHMQLHMSWYIRSLFGFTFLNILYFFKYSCTNIFQRRSLYTFYYYGLCQINIFEVEVDVCWNFVC